MTEQDKPATAPTSAIANPQRRSLLRGAGLFGGGLLAGGLGSAAWCGNLASPADPASEVVPYRGAHQAGITTPAPQEAIFIAFDVLAKDRQGLQQTLQLLTERIAFLTRGGPAAVSPAWWAIPCRQTASPSPGRWEPPCLMGVLACKHSGRST